MVKVGISTAAFYPTHLTEEALDRIAALGFRTVEIFLQSDSEYTEAFGEELAKRTCDLGLNVHSIHLYAYYFDLWSAYPRMRAETQGRFRRLLEIAARLGAQALTWHGLRYAVDNPRLVSAFFESAVWAGRQAQEAGLMLCLENVSWCYLRTPEHVATIRRANLPVGFTFDTFQAGESGTEHTALIRAMNADRRLYTVHISDYAPGASRHLLPGQGILDWEGILGALQRSGYTGPLILEPAHVQELDALLKARTFIESAWHRSQEGRNRDTDRI